MSFKVLLSQKVDIRVHLNSFGQLFPFGEDFDLSSGSAKKSFWFIYFYCGYNMMLCLFNTRSILYVQYMAKLLKIKYDGS